MKNQLLINQLHFYTHPHPVHNAQEVTTQQTCAAIARTQQLDPRGTKLEILMLQQTRVIYQERVHKCPEVHPQETLN